MKNIILKLKQMLCSKVIKPSTCKRLNVEYESTVASAKSFAKYLIDTHNERRWLKLSDGVYSDFHDQVRQSLKAKYER